MALSPIDIVARFQSGELTKNELFILLCRRLPHTKWCDAFSILEAEFQRDFVDWIENDVAKNGQQIFMPEAGRLFSDDEIEIARAWANGRRVKRLLDSRDARTHQ